MKSLPDLTKLSHQEKDELIVLLWSYIEVLQKQNEELRGRIVELERRLSLNSRNSSKPPSSDGFKKPEPKSLRKSGQLKSGGQKGHIGKTLRQVDNPDETVAHHAPRKCDACGLDLPEGEIAEKRQVFDVPELKLKVTEHQVFKASCTCGKVHCGQFPGSVKSGVQYGARTQAVTVYLSQHHMLPLKRVTDIIADFFGLPLSQATVVKAIETARNCLTETVDKIKEALKNVRVLNADETGMRVGKALKWMHVATTYSLTWIGLSDHRGKKAFDEFNVLPNFYGILVHDGWVPYRALSCTHALCNAHHLRELLYVAENFKQDWATELSETLNYANSQVKKTGPFSPERMQHLRYVYEEILLTAELMNPRAPPLGKPGKVKQSKAVNLIGRLREHANDVLRFAENSAVPFTNNLAEQSIRMPKVKQKVSGCFRTVPGAMRFCVIRSYLVTMQKQSRNLFDALVHTFKGQTPQPNFY